MKKFAALFLTGIIAVTSISMPAYAEEALDPAIQESASGFYYIEAEGERPRLSAKDPSLFFQVDGEWYKDLNRNGELDAYEDWHLSSQERAENLLSLMTINEKAGTLGFGGISGSNGIVVTDAGTDVTSITGDTSVITPEHPTMTASADEVFVTAGASTYPSMRYQAQVMGISTYIGAMTGTPKDQLSVANAMQAIQEESRLGIPCVISGDRSYNTWGGMIDMPHYALGVARDEELLYNLVSVYAKESVAIGYQQVFHGYGNEIGSFYGDDPAYIATMAGIETHAYQDNNFSAHSKHFIARGGRSNYAGARSEADLIDSWMIGWKAVVDAGTDYVMTNNGVARTPGLMGIFDKDTYDLLRVDLGYDGVVCLDWPMGPDSIMGETGVTSDGIDISTLTLGEKYVLILNAGVDMFSCGYEVPGEYDPESITGFGMVYYPDVLIAEIEAGKYTEEEMDVHVIRVIRNKFDLGIFENPYRDWEEAKALIGSDAYQAEEFVPMNNEEINLARKEEVNQMEEEVMIKSTILLKNDGILPLGADAKVYIDSNAAACKEADTAAIGEKAQVADSFEDATAALFHATSFDDTYELFIEDAQDAGVPVIVIFEGTVSSEPGLTQFTDSNALIMQTYNNTPDHGSSFGSYYRYVTPSVTAQMLFGEKEPQGKTLFELAYDNMGKTLSWGELQDDIGVDDATRLYMAMLAKRNPEIDMPNNLGDVIVTTDFGMNYSDAADIQLSLLTLPRTVVEEEVEGSSGTSMQTSVSSITPKAGEAFKISFVAENVGTGDGLITVPVYDNDTLIAEKVVGVTADQFRVISMDIVLEAGEHVLTVGDMSASLTVE